jgi:hypothetical protein
MHSQNKTSNFGKAIFAKLFKGTNYGALAAIVNFQSV